MLLVEMTKHASSSSSSGTYEYRIGDLHMVRTKNGVHHGEIVEKRPSKQLRDKQKVSSGSNTSQLKPSDCEFYIHFPNFDRRMDEWVPYDRVGAPYVPDTSSTEDINDGAPSSSQKNKKRKGLDSDTPSTVDKKKEDEKGVEIAALEKENEDMTKVRNIERISIGKFEVDAWYYSPYPEEYCGGEMLYICEYCLKYALTKEVITKHSAKCTSHMPPGREIYREDNLSMWEIDGQDHKIYCQNLCLLSKLFLDHKTLYYDVDPFLFYVLCEVDEHGGHIVGYFSKEKTSTENNLACILTFPQYQRKGYGKLLISISYELTKLENTTGSPEKPLSDLGKISYRSYWAFVIGRCFEANTDISMQDIQTMTGIKYDDILSTLHSMNLLKSWKGQYVISIKKEFLEQQKLQAKRIRLCNPQLLRWTPPVDKNEKKTGEKSR